MFKVEYQWSGRLVDSSKAEIDFAGKSGFLSMGVNTIDISFDGRKIGEKGVNGPYAVTGFLMLGAGNSIIASDVAITKPYNFTDFEGVFNHLPIADAGPDQILECAGHAGTSAILNGSASYDPDGDSLAYLWQGIFGASNDISPAVPLPLGSQIITLEVNDGRGASDSDEVTIAVTDSTPPTLSAQWIPLDVQDDEEKFRLDFSATDICDPAVAVRGIIKTPSLDGLEVDLEVAPTMKIEFDFEENKLEVKGPDPAGVFAQLQNLGGLIVENGQIVRVEAEEDNNEFEMKFDENGIKIEASHPILKVAGYDRSGNTATVEAVPTFFAEDDD